MRVKNHRPIAVTFRRLHAAVLMCVVSACNTSNGPSGDALPALTPPVVPVASVPISAAQGAPATPDFATLASHAVPAVVSIQTEQHMKMDGNSDPYAMFRFFGQAPPREFENRGLGSGFVIEPGGLILTNQHVIEKADAIHVTFALPDGSEKVMAAKIVGQAPEYDVALIKTEEDAKATSVLPLGDSAAMRIGDWVMAVGNPFGLDHSVSVGIISAKDRRDVAPSGRKGFYDFLQTDASINPGNSGGPLLNLQGEVIGINAAINAQGQGIGFAIPVNMIKEMLPQLKQSGRFVRSWLGLRIQPLTAELAQSFGLDAPRGALVAEVVADGPAAKAGVKEGDIILEFDGKRLNRVIDLQLFASMSGVGKEVPLQVQRDGKPVRLTVRLEALPEDGEQDGASQNGTPGATERGAPEALGLTVADVPPAYRAELGEGVRGGALITRVLPGSLGQRAGLGRGDVVLSVDEARLTDARDFIARVTKAKSGAVLRLRVLRQGGRTFVALKKP